MQLKAHQQPIAATKNLADTASTVRVCSNPPHRQRKRETPMLYTPGFRLDQIEWTDPRLPKGSLRPLWKKLKQLSKEIKLDRQRERREARKQIRASLDQITLDRQAILEIEQREKLQADRLADYTATVEIVRKMLDQVKAKQDEIAAWRKSALAKLEEANKAITRSERIELLKRGVLRGRRK
jgi:DNA repair ATPase RecN